tara:strand:- start:319 stop:750 length:432 start_codon:yes stop_codon:yes gene_type:complete
MINYQYINNKKLNNEDQISFWLNNIIENEGKKTGNLVYILCKDKYLLKKNIEFLKHDTLTDVITFNYCKNKTISGDIIISTERVLENSKLYNEHYMVELRRVILHGLLHLIGYDDKNKNDIQIMRTKEDFYLNKFTSTINDNK